MKKIFSFCPLFLLLIVNSALADIYRYTSRDGVECYTDAPINRKSVIVIHEKHRQKKPVTKSAEEKSLKSADSASLSMSTRQNTKAASLTLPVAGIVSSPVGLRYDPIDGLLRNHNGVDIAIPEGTPVKPVAPGVISYSGMRGGYGNIVIIEHDGGMTTIYAHNRVNLVACGNRVDKNSTIALSGSTGRSTGPHLHFEAWLDEQNITDQFLSDPGSIRKTQANRTVVRKSRPVRKIIMADGSIVLTNLPLVHP